MLVPRHRILQQLVKLFLREVAIGNDWHHGNMILARRFQHQRIRPVRKLAHPHPRCTTPEPEYRLYRRAPGTIELTSDLSSGKKEISACCACPAGTAKLVKLAKAKTVTVDSSFAQFSRAWPSNSTQRIRLNRQFALFVVYVSPGLLANSSLRPSRSFHFTSITFINSLKLGSGPHRAFSGRICPPAPFDNKNK